MNKVSGVEINPERLTRLASKEGVHDKAVEARGGELVNPYLIYEMAIGGGCTEAEAKKEMQMYCLEVGLDPLCP